MYDKKIVLESTPLASLPILSQCSKHGLARLVSSITMRDFKANEPIYEAGAAAEETCFVVSGRIRLSAGKRQIGDVSQGFVGEEACLGGANYVMTATAVEDTRVMAIGKTALAELLDEYPDARSEMYRSLVNHSVWGHPFQSKASRKAPKKDSIFKGVGWVAAVLVPALVYMFGTDAALGAPMVNFLAIFSAAAVMWVFGVVPEFVPALIVIMAVMVLGLVPNEVILAGYASSSFFMAMSVFGIGTVLSQSGIIYRFALYILRLTPPSNRAYQLVLFFIGVLLIPLLPSTNSRIGLVTPLAIDMIGALRFRPGGKAATRIIASTFSGASLMSAGFLTSKPVNFALFGLFPNQVKEQFSWGYWAYAALASSLVLFLGDYLLSRLMFRDDEKPKISRQDLEIQLANLGRFTSAEWFSLMGIGLFMVGVMSSSIHKISPSGIGLSILCILLAIGSLSQLKFRRSIDWPFLMMLGGFVGIVKTIAYLGIDKWVGSHLMWMGQFMHDQFGVFVLLLGGVIYLLRFALPNAATVILMASVFIPIGIEQGINPWIIGFVVLVFSDSWFMPYQCSYYVQMEEIAGKKQVYDRKRMLLFNGISNIFRFTSVYVSIPYWKAIGLL